jgi:hypothetical protein
VIGADGLSKAGLFGVLEKEYSTMTASEAAIRKAYSSPKTKTFSDGRESEGPRESVKLPIEISAKVAGTSILVSLEKYWRLI